jgi:putative ABC transport system permease protein
MPGLRQLVARLRALVGYAAAERALSDEVETHLALLADEFGRRGLPPADAMRAARRAFGGVDQMKEAYRDQRGFPAVESLGHDLRLAVRQLTAAPWFSAAVVTTLASGMGTAILVFAILNAMVLRPAPFHRPGDLIDLTTRTASGQLRGASYADFLEWRANLTSFTDLAAYAGATMNVGVPGRTTERVQGTFISAQAFDLLGDTPLLGRRFSVADDAVGAPAVVLLSHGVWLNLFGAAADVVGREVRVNGIPTTVVGVMEPGFSFPLTAAMWRPFAQMPEAVSEARDARRIGVVGRLASGHTLGSARAELATVGQALARAHPGTDAGIVPVATPFQERFLGRLSDEPPMILMAAATFVLLIACANAASLLFARSSFRHAEMALRSALGASRGRLIGQLVTESLVLAAVAGAVGTGLAVAGLRLFAAQTTDLGLPPWTRFTMDASVAGFAVVLVCLVAVGFGVAPAWRISGSTDPRVPADASRGGSRTLALARPLLAAQVALSIALLSATWMLSRHSSDLARADDVIDARTITVARVTLDAAAYPTPESRSAYYEALRSRLHAHPSLVAATIATAPPFHFADERPLAVESSVESDDPDTVLVVGVDRSYFATLGLPVVRGRGITLEDERPAASVAVVNERFAARYLGGHDPLSRRLKLGMNRSGDPGTDWLTVVGVVPSVRQVAMNEARPVVYVPRPAERRSEVFVLARPRPGVAAGPVLREQAAAVDPDVPLYDIQPLDHISRMSRWTARTFSAVLAMLGGLAVLLSSLGVYAVTAYGVTRRVKEIGVRMALGCTPRQVAALLARSTAGTLVAGLVCGAVGAAALTRLAYGTLLRSATTPSWPAVLAPVALVVVVSFIAVVIPTGRATRGDPVAALRRD